MTASTVAAVLPVRDRGLRSASGDHVGGEDAGSGGRAYRGRGPVHRSMT